VCAEVFPWADTEAIDLLNNLLCYDPALRPTAKQVCPIKKKYIQTSPRHCRAGVSPLTCFTSC
jgi:hypothetical protein